MRRSRFSCGIKNDSEIMCAYHGWCFKKNGDCSSLPGLESTLVLYGLILLGLITLGAIVMIAPPKGYVPLGWDPKTDAIDPNFTVALLENTTNDAHQGRFTSAVGTK